MVRCYQLCPVRTADTNMQPTDIYIYIYIYRQFCQAFSLFHAVVDLINKEESLSVGLCQRCVMIGAPPAEPTESNSPAVVHPFLLLRIKLDVKIPWDTAVLCGYRNR